MCIRDSDGQGRFSDATEAQMPPPLVRFSWDLELADVDNDLSLIHISEPTRPY